MNEAINTFLLYYELKINCKLKFIRWITLHSSRLKVLIK